MKIKIAELGILDGSSLLMWNEYFINAEIYGFDHNYDFINKFKSYFNNDKITLSHIDGVEPIFKNINKLTIITPCYRVENLLLLKNSINFDYVEEWIIVYDNPKKFENQENNKIKEFLHTSDGISGNPQRNFALNQIQNPNALLYYLDDDNILHPNIYNLLNIIDNTKFYSFNQYFGRKGNNIGVGYNSF